MIAQERHICECLSKMNFENRHFWHFCQLLPCTTFSLIVAKRKKMYGCVVEFVLFIYQNVSILGLKLKICNKVAFWHFCWVLTSDLRICPCFAGVKKSDLFLQIIRAFPLQILILETMSILSAPKYPNETCKVSNCLPYLKFYFDADFKFVLRDWEKGFYCCGNPYFTALRSSWK